MIVRSATLTRTRCLRLLLLLTLLLATSACVQPRLYRPQNIQPEEGYTLAYIEFDDQGELWSPSQMFRTTELIKRANETKQRTLTVVFIHGWQNNASSKQEQQAGKSLYGFKQLLSGVVQQVAGDYPTPPPVTGVYLAWRGKSAHKPFHGFTFWNRRRTATRIASSGAVSEVLSRIVETTNQNPESRIMLIGHSFGGLLMEQALLQYLVNSTVAAHAGEELRFPVDLVMLLNPASSSLRAKQLVEVFARDRAKVYQVDKKGKRYERPLMISVTSKTDFATRALYPAGTALGLIFTRFRTYGSEFCSPTEKQRKFYLYTAGHNKVLHSHVVTAKSLPKEDGSGKKTDLQLREDPTDQSTIISFNGDKHRFTIRKKRAALNDTPYWIMSVPHSLIPDHSTIFGVDTIRLMAALVRATGALEPDSRTVLVRETGLRPLGLAVRPTGELVIVEAERRIYSLPVGSSTPVFLSCLPPDVDPTDSIGAFRTGDEVTVALNWRTEEDDEDKEAKYRTEMLNVSLSKGGFHKAKPGRIAGSMQFFAAAGDPVSRKLYLATRDEIYVADLTKSGRPEPKPLVRIDAKLEQLDFDPNKQQLFAVDRENGRLYLVDLRAETPQVRLAAEGLGWPVDVIVAPTDGRIYVSDTKNRQIWWLECDDVRCTKPEVFSRADAFQAPSRMAAAPDNTLWVTDPKAHKIFALWPDGKIRQTISSLAGETQ